MLRYVRVRRPSEAYGYVMLLGMAGLVLGWFLGLPEFLGMPRHTYLVMMGLDILTAMWFVVDLIVVRRRESVRASMTVQ